MAASKHSSRLEEAHVDNFDLISLLDEVLVDAVDVLSFLEGDDGVLMDAANVLSLQYEIEIDVNDR